MSFTRRSFLIGAGSGLSLLLLTACTTPEPEPEPTPTLTPTPEPSALPEPAGLQRSSWSTESVAMGSHRYITPGTSPDLRGVLAAPVIDRVFFAGEATSVEHASSVRGARESGARAAGEVAVVTTPAERVAVVGAGAAGAEAARLLTLYGYDVVVIEAQDRTGGRIHTVEDDDWPIPVELGAWTFDQSTDESILDQLERLGVDTAPLGSTTYRAQRDGTQDGAPDGSGDATDDTVPEIDTNTVGLTAISTALAWATEQTRDFSLQDALDGSGATETASGEELNGLDGATLLGTELSVIANTTGAAASELSSWYGYTVPAQDAAPTLLATGPVSALIDDALDGVETFLSTAVVGVSYSEDGVSLRLGTGESLSVDRAIVTVPLGVLQNGGIEFSPLLPFAHRNAITQLGVGTVDTVWLRFDEPFWSSPAAVWNVVGTSTEITTWINLQAITGDPVLVGIVGGAQAVRLAELSDDELRDAAMLSLAPFASTGA
ncbi:MAG: FAD-dependent oxidoreductase [Glaciihabitans sp.]